MVESLVQVARVLGGGAVLAREIALAARSPHAYFERFAARLAKRGLASPVEDSAWLALVDGAIARRRLVEIDWKEAPVDIDRALRELRPARPLPRSVASHAPIDRAAVTTHRVRLVAPDGSGTHNFADVPWSRLGELTFEEAPVGGLGWLTLAVRGRPAQAFHLICDESLRAAMSRTRADEKRRVK